MPSQHQSKPSFDTCQHPVVKAIIICILLINVMNKLLSYWIINEIRNTGFDQEVETLPASENISDPTGLLYFSMTEINKLGINPQSIYKTPLGIYCYPLTEEYKEKLINNELPFAGHQPYVQVFSIKPNTKIFDINNYNNLEQDKETLVDWLLSSPKFLEKINSSAEQGFYIKKLLNFFIDNNFFIEQIKTILNPELVNDSNELKEFYDSFVEIVKNQPASPLFSSFLQTYKKGVDENDTKIFLSMIINHLFKKIKKEYYKEYNLFPDEIKLSELRKQMSSELFSDFNEMSPDQSKFGIIELFHRWEEEAIQNTDAAKIWNITRMLAQGLASSKGMVMWAFILDKVLGYQGATDFGDGLIYEDEPTQAVWFSYRPIQFQKTILNKNSDKKLDPTSPPKNEFKSQRTSQNLWHSDIAQYTKSFFENVIEKYYPNEKFSFTIPNFVKAIEGLTIEQIEEAAVDLTINSSEQIGYFLLILKNPSEKMKFLVKQLFGELYSSTIKKIINSFGERSINSSSYRDYIINGIGQVISNQIATPMSLYDLFNGFLFGKPQNLYTNLELAEYTLKTFDSYFPKTVQEFVTSDRSKRY